MPTIIPDRAGQFNTCSEKKVSGVRDTVYRTLATLESKGLIRRTGALGGPARYDANMDRHHHFVCKVCGMVKDFSSEAMDELPIHKSVKQSLWHRRIRTSAGSRYMLIVCRQKGKGPATFADIDLFGL